MGTANVGATQITTQQGILTQYGITLPPGAQVAAFVRSTGLQSQDTSFLAQNLVSTLAAGIARARPGLNDFVICLPGHAENIADGTTFSAALLAGTNILGVGVGTSRPTFTFTATTSAMNVAVNNVSIMGCLFLLDGINAVVNAFNITGADFNFVGNEVETSSAAKAPTTWMTLTATANRANIAGNVFRGLAASVSTNGIVISGACTDVRIEGNEFFCPVTAATGHISVTGAAIALRIANNLMYNTAAASTVCISFAAVASDGVLAYNTYGILTNGVASATGVTFGAGCLVKSFQCFCSDEPQKSGVLSPVVVAT